MFIEKKVRRYSLLDAGMVCKLMRTDGIFKTSGDDFSDVGKLACFVENNLRAQYVFVMGIDPRHECFVFNPMHTTSCFVAHFAVHPAHRGPVAKQHLIESARYVFQNSPCRAIMGFIRSANLPARLFATDIGMKRIGRTHGTLMFDGCMEDEIIYQCTLEDFNEKYGATSGSVKDRIQKK